MANTISLILLCIALALFFLGAIGIPLGSANLMLWGMLFFAASFLPQKIPAPAR